MTDSEFNKELDFWMDALDAKKENMAKTPVIEPGEPEAVEIKGKEVEKSSTDNSVPVVNKMDTQGYQKRMQYKDDGKGNMMPWREVYTKDGMNYYDGEGNIVASAGDTGDQNIENRVERMTPEQDIQNRVRNMYDRIERTDKTLGRTAALNLMNEALFNGKNRIAISGTEDPQAYKEQISNTAMQMYSNMYADKHPEEVHDYQVESLSADVDANYNTLKAEQAQNMANGSSLGMMRQQSAMGYADIPMYLDPQKQKDLENWQYAQAWLNGAKDMRQYAESMKGAGRLERLGKGFVHGAKEVLSSGPMGIGTLQMIMPVGRVFDKLNDGVELNQSEQALLDAYMYNCQAQSLYGNQGMAASAGNVTAQSLPFMLEMLVNPLAKSGDVIVEGASKGLVKYMVKKFGSNAVRSAIELTKGETRNILTKALGTAVKGAIGAGALTATTSMPSVLADAERRHIGTPDRGETGWDGRYHMTGSTDGVERSEAMKKAFTASWIEHYSEYLGEIFPDIELPQMVKRFVKGGGELTEDAFKSICTRMGVDGDRCLTFMAQKAVQTMNLPGLRQAKNFTKGIATAEQKQFITNLQKDIHWDGNIGEYGEEVLGGIMNAIMVGDQELNTGENGVFNLEQNIETYLSVAVMGEVFHAANIAGGLKRGYDLSVGKENALRNMSYWNTLGRDRWLDNWDGIKEQIDNADDTNMTSVLSGIISRAKNNGQKEAVMQYAAQKQKSDAIDNQLVGEGAEAEGDQQKSEFGIDKGATIKADIADGVTSARVLEVRNGGFTESGERVDNGVVINYKKADKDGNLKEVTETVSESWLQDQIISQRLKDEEQERKQAIASGNIDATRQAEMDATAALDYFGMDYNQAEQYARAIVKNNQATEQDKQMAWRLLKAGEAQKGVQERMQKAVDAVVAQQEQSMEGKTYTDAEGNKLLIETKTYDGRKAYVVGGDLNGMVVLADENGQPIMNVKGQQAKYLANNLQMTTTNVEDRLNEVRQEAWNEAGKAINEQVWALPQQGEKVVLNENGDVAAFVGTRMAMTKDGQPMGMVAVLNKDGKEVTEDLDTFKVRQQDIAIQMRNQEWQAENQKTQNPSVASEQIAMDADGNIDTGKNDVKAVYDYLEKKGQGKAVAFAEAKVADLQTQLTEAQKPLQRDGMNDMQFMDALDAQQALIGKIEDDINYWQRVAKEKNVREAQALVDAMHEQERKKGEVLKAINERIGWLPQKLGLELNVELASNEENGKVDLKNKKITVFLNADDVTADQMADTVEKAVSAAFGHEVNHVLFAENPDLAKTFKEAVKRYLGEAEFNRLVESKRRAYTEQLKDKSEQKAYDYLAEEVACDMAGRMLLDSNYVNALRNGENLNADEVALTQEPSLLTKVVQFIDSMLEKLGLKEGEDIFAGTDVELAVQRVKDAREAWKEMLDKAVEQNKTGVSEESEKYAKKMEYISLPAEGTYEKGVEEVFENNKGREEVMTIHTRLSEVDKKQPIVIDKHSYSKDYLNSLYKGFSPITNINTGETIVFYAKGFEKNYRVGGNFAKVVPQLPEICKSASLAYSQEDNLAGALRKDGTSHKAHPQYLGFGNYLNKVNIDGEEYYVRLTVQREKGRTGLHSTMVTAVDLYKYPANEESGQPLSGKGILDISRISDTKLRNYIEICKKKEENILSADLNSVNADERGSLKQNIRYSQKTGEIAPKMYRTREEQIAERKSYDEFLGMLWKDGKTLMNGETANSAEQIEQVLKSAQELLEVGIETRNKILAKRGQDFFTPEQMAEREGEDRALREYIRRLQMEVDRQRANALVVKMVSPELPKKNQPNEGVALPTGQLSEEGKVRMEMYGNKELNEVLRNISNLSKELGGVIGDASAGAYIREDGTPDLEKAKEIADAMIPALMRYKDALTNFQGYHTGAPTVRDEVVYPIKQDIDKAIDFYIRFANGEKIDHFDEGIRFSLKGVKGATMMDYNDGGGRMVELDKAKAMLGDLDYASLSREEKLRIKKATGWEQGLDGKWRYETEDGVLKDWDGSTTTLVEVWDDASLYEAYPDMRSLPISTKDFGKGLGAVTTDKGITMNTTLLSDKDKMRSLLAHEIQHAVQDKEGFDFGTGGFAVKMRNDREAEKQVLRKHGINKGGILFNEFYVGDLREYIKYLEDKYGVGNELSMSIPEAPNADNYEGWYNNRQYQLDYEAYRQFANNVESGKQDFADGKVVENFKSKLPQSAADGFDKAVSRMYEWQKILKEIEEAKESGIYKKDFYHLNSGEVEARNIEARLNMTPEERRNTLAEDTEDVPRSEQERFSRKEFDETKLVPKGGERKLSKWGLAKFSSLYKGVTGSDQLPYAKVWFNVAVGEPYVKLDTVLTPTVFANLPKECFVMDGDDFVSVNMNKADEYIRPYIIEGVKATIKKYNKNNRYSHKIRQADPFVSNAAVAVEGLRQEKASGEQWLKMIEKAGGLKKEEDKWIGLSDWLHQQDALALTGARPKAVSKQEVMDYIAQNAVKVEEVKYGKADGDVFESENMLINFQSDIQRGIENGESIEDVLRSLDMEFKTKTLEAYREGKFNIDKHGHILTDQEINNPIVSTRLGYTTKGLKNKKEIALTVPTIEPYNEGDEVHFGDAGDGRAVAWIRFGDAKEFTPEYIDAKKTVEEFGNAMMSKYGTDRFETVKMLNTEEKAQFDSLIAELKKVEQNKSNGKRVLVIDEIQSKRHQDGRERGYKEKNNVEVPNWAYGEFVDKYGLGIADLLDENGNKVGLIHRNGSGYYAIVDGKTTEIHATPEDAIKAIANKLAEDPNNKVPDAPFQKNWHELAMKRMLRYAAENGYDKVAWTTGAQQAERYDIGGVVKSIYADHDNYDGNPHKYVSINLNGGGNITFEVDKDGIIESSETDPTEYDGKLLSEVVGKELADKIANLPQDQHGIEFGQQDLRLGGEGMKGFYDQMLPRFMDKYGRKWGVKTHDVELDLPNETDRRMHAVDVSESMKESVMQGQVMFSKKQDVAKIESLKAQYEELERRLKDTGITERNRHARLRSRQNDVLKKLAELGVGMENGRLVIPHHASAITTFSGGGLIEAGLKGFIDPKVAVEYDKSIIPTYITNHGGKKVKVDGAYTMPEGGHIAILGGIQDVDLPKLAEAMGYEPVEYLHGSPVCKNFSNAKVGAEETTLDMVTAKAYADFIREFTPNVVTVENVAAYRTSKALQEIIDALDESGYSDWDMDIYDSANYGGATSRRRLILRAVKSGTLPPKPAYRKPTPWYERVKDLVGNGTESSLPSHLVERLSNMGVDWKNLDKPLLVGDNGFEKARIAYADQPAFTILAGGQEWIVMPGGKVIDVSPRMLARITGLPDTYQLPEQKRLAHTIIGNGVPTELTRAVIAPIVQKRVNHVVEKKEIADEIERRYKEAVLNGNNAEVERLFDEYVYQQAEDNIVPFLAANTNYKKVRKIAHMIKGEDINGNKLSKETQLEACNLAAMEMADQLPENAVLIPIPSRNGKATDTLLLAQAISRLTGASVIDALEGMERESVHDRKLAGKKVNPEMLGLKMKDDVRMPVGKRKVYIDNVIDKGNTASAAVRAGHGGVVLAYAYSGKMQTGMKLKSAVAATFDNDDKLIPLSERFNPKSTDVRYSMKGEKGAYTLDKADGGTRMLDLNDAKWMVDWMGGDYNKLSAEEKLRIKVATGWEQGADGKWRHESVGLKWKTDAFTKRWGKNVKLSDIVEDNELFKAYPELNDIIVKRSNKASEAGSFNGVTNIMTVNTSTLKFYNEIGSQSGIESELKDLQDTLNHEIQHWIQSKEGFAKGGNWSADWTEAKQHPVEFAMIQAFGANLPRLKQNPYSNIRRLLENGLISHRTSDGMRQQIRLLLDNLTADNMATLAARAEKLRKQAMLLGKQNYPKLAGEVEARNAGRRSFFTEEELRNSLAESTEEEKYPRSEQIVRFSLKEERKSVINPNETVRIPENGVTLQSDTDLKFDKDFTNLMSRMEGEDWWNKAQTRLEVMDLVKEYARNSGYNDTQVYSGLAMAMLGEAFHMRPSGLFEFAKTGMKRIVTGKGTLKGMYLPFEDKPYSLTNSFKTAEDVKKNLAHEATHQDNDYDRTYINAVVDMVNNGELSKKDLVKMVLGDKGNKSYKEYNLKKLANEVIARGVANRYAGRPDAEFTDNTKLNQIIDEAYARRENNRLRSQIGKRSVYTPSSNRGRGGYNGAFEERESWDSTRPVADDVRAGGREAVSGRGVADILGYAEQKVADNNVRYALKQLKDSFEEASKQDFGSAGTSINGNKLPSGFGLISKIGGFKEGTRNLDMGGGRFDNATEMLAGMGVENMVFDPYNRDAEHNKRVAGVARTEGFDTTICNNCLNVINTAGARSNVILQCAKALKPGGTAYFTVYEGNGSGEGKVTQKGESWQENRKTADYVDEIKQHFADVIVKGKLIIAKEPIVEGKTSIWNFNGFADDGNTRYAKKQKFDEPQNVEEFVAQNFRKVSIESVKKEMGYNSKDYRGLSRFVGNDGISIAKAAEDICNDMPDGFREQCDDQQVRDIIIDILQSGGPRKYLLDAKHVRDEQEREAMIAERDQYYQEGYGMTYDQYMDSLDALRERYTGRTISQTRRTRQAIEMNDAQKKVANEIRALLRDEYLPAADKAEINRLLSYVQNARPEQLKWYIDHVRSTVADMRIKRQARDINRVLGLKTQDVNGRNMSIAKNVDDTTRRVFDIIRTDAKLLQITEVDNQLESVNGELNRMRAELRGMKAMQMRGDIEGAEAEALEYDIMQTEAEIAGLNERAKQLREDRKILRSGNAEIAVTDLDGKLQTLAEKEEAWLNGQGSWTAEDSALKAAYTVLKQKAEVEKMNTHISHISNLINRAQTEGERDALRKTFIQAKQEKADKQEELLRMITEIADNGHESLLEQQKKERELKKELIRGTFSDIGGEGGKALPQGYTGHGANRKTKQEDRKTEGWLKKFTTLPLGSFEYMAHRIDRNHMSHDGWFYKHFVTGENGVLAAQNEYLARHREACKTMNEKSREIFGKDLDKVMEEQSKLHVHSGCYMYHKVDDEMQRGEQLELSKGMATYLYMVNKMADGKMKLEKMGITDETMREIEEFIGEQNMAWADWVQDEFLPSLRGRYNDVYKQIFGTSMAQVENYVPLKIDKSSIQGKEDMNGTSGQQNMQPKTGSLINRTYNTLPIDLSTDAFLVVVDHMNKMEEFAAFAPVRRELEWVLNSAAVRNQMDANVAGQWKALYDAARIAVHAEEPEGIKGLDDAMSKFAKGLVGGNIAFRTTTALKQILSAPAFYGYSQDPRFIATLTKNIGMQYAGNAASVLANIATFGFLNKKQMKALDEAEKNGKMKAGLTATVKWCVENVPSFRDRLMKGNIGIEVLDANGWDNKIGHWIDIYLNQGMSTNKLVDAITCSIGIKSIYDYKMTIETARINKLMIARRGELNKERDRLIAQTKASMERNGGQLIEGQKSPEMIEMEYYDKYMDEKAEKMEQARRMALMEADVYYNGTQQSNHRAFMSPMQLSTSTLNRMMSVYQNASIGFARKAAESWQNLSKNGDILVRTYMKEGMSEEEAKKKVWNGKRKALFSLAMYGIVTNLIWDMGSRGLIGLFQDDDDKEWWKDWTNWISYPMRGMPLNNMLPKIMNGQGFEPFLILNEGEDIAKKGTKIAEDYGTLSPEFATFVINRAMKVGGVNPEVWVNTAMGVTDLIENGLVKGEDVDKMTDLMLILQTPNSNRGKVAKELYKDRPIKEYQDAVMKAMKYVDEDSWKRLLPGFKKATEEQRTKILNQLIEYQLTPEQKEELNNCLLWQAEAKKKVKDLKKHSDKYDSFEDDTEADRYYQSHRKEIDAYDDLTDAISEMNDIRTEIREGEMKDRPKLFEELKKVLKANDKPEQK